MATRIGPQSIQTENLIGLWDVGSPRSFKGEVIDNILTQVSQQYGTSYGTYLRTVSNTQNVYIPTVNKTVRTRVTDFYNDYGGGSGNCCPNIYTYGTNNTNGAVSGSPVTGSTLYTYSIIYKTTTGYTNPNYMYRYEFNSSNSYLTESGVHNDSNRTSLGDGWYHAWGQFTSQPTCVRFHTYFFHYEYAKYNTTYLASAQLIPGGRIMPAQYQIFNVESGNGRNSFYDVNSIGTSEFNYGKPKPGGLLDISGKGHHGELRNGPYYDSDGGGCLVFDGSNDGVVIEDTNWLNPGTFTIVAWVKSSNFNQSGFIFEKTTNGNVNTQYSLFFNGNNVFYFRIMNSSNQDLTFTTSSYFTNNNWHHVVATYDGAFKRVYVNGSQAGVAQATQGLPGGGTNNTGPAYIGIFGSFAGYPFNGKIAKVAVYDRALTASEVSSDYNATKGRFGL